MKTTIAATALLITISACHNKTPLDTTSQADSLSADTIVQESASLSAHHSLHLAKGEYKSETAFAVIDATITLPADSDAVSRAIARDLIDRIDKSLAYDMMSESRSTEPYRGSAADATAVITHYGKAMMASMEAASREDHQARLETMMPGEDKPEPAQYSCDFDVSHTLTLPAFYVYNIENHVYSGGAHGMSIGMGHITYLRTTGRVFTDFFKPGCERQMQPLIRQGLIDYFNDSDMGQTVSAANLNDYLQIEGTLVPMPAITPYPSADGMEFVYQQYEIAAYAAGMPSFTLPYSKLLPYLTAEARELLGL